MRRRAWKLLANGEVRINVSHRQSQDVPEVVSGWPPHQHSFCYFPCPRQALLIHAASFPINPGSAAGSSMLQSRSQTRESGEIKPIVIAS